MLPLLLQVATTGVLESFEIAIASAQACGGFAEYNVEWRGPQPRGVAAAAAGCGSSSGGSSGSSGYLMLPGWRPAGLSQALQEMRCAYQATIEAMQDGRSSHAGMAARQPTPQPGPQTVVNDGEVAASNAHAALQSARAPQQQPQQHQQQPAQQLQQQHWQAPVQLPVATRQPHHTHAQQPWTQAQPPLHPPSRQRPQHALQAQQCPTVVQQQAAPHPLQAAPHGQLPFGPPAQPQQFATPDRPTVMPQPPPQQQQHQHQQQPWRPAPCPAAPLQHSSTAAFQPPCSVGYSPMATPGQPRPVFTPTSLPPAQLHRLPQQPHRPAGPLAPQSCQNASRPEPNAASYSAAPLPPTPFPDVGKTRDALADVSSAANMQPPVPQVYSGKLAQPQAVTPAQATPCTTSTSAVSGGVIRPVVVASPSLTAIGVRPHVPTPVPAQRTPLAVHPSPMDTPTPAGPLHNARSAPMALSNVAPRLAAQQGCMPPRAPQRGTASGAAGNTPAQVAGTGSSMKRAYRSERAEEAAQKRSRQALGGGGAAGSASQCDSDDAAGFVESL